MKKIYLSLLLVMPMLVGTKQALAQVSPEDYGINDVINAGANLGGKPLRETIAGLINVIRGFLGVIATVLVVFGGFRIMFAYGDSDKVSQGKTAVAAGAIGIAIVLAAWAIASFVLNEIYNAVV